MKVPLPYSKLSKSGRLQAFDTVSLKFPSQSRFHRRSQYRQQLNKDETPQTFSIYISLIVLMQQLQLSRRTKTCKTIPSTNIRIPTAFAIVRIVNIPKQTRQVKLRRVPSPSQAHACPNTGILT